jgi:hypothetical protein
MTTAQILNVLDNDPWSSNRVNPITLTGRPDVQYFAYSQDWSDDGFDNDGDGTIDTGVEANENLNYFTMYAFARTFRNGATASRQVEHIVSGVNVNVWQNAVFAGSGQAGFLINGNVSIHGSVHLLGDNLGAGGIALAALDLSGTSLIHNNYEGLSNDLRSRIPALPTREFDGEIVETLNASLRVKQGLVGMSGTSEVGEAHQLGNSFKETMDGVYVNDGWTGTDVDANGDPQSVYSDNGWDTEYDLGELVPFPTYGDDGGRNHLDYYTNLDGTANSGLNAIFEGDITLDARGDNFYWNATTMSAGDEVIGGTPGDGSMPTEADLDPDHFYVWFDADSDKLIINGRIPVAGNLTFTGSGGDRTINYEGKGTFLTYDAGTGGGDVVLSASLLTDSFPSNLIGVHAQNEFQIGVGAQIEMMGGFYSEGAIRVDKQTTILGSIVGDYFDMGTNVPDIYQVPALSAAWAPDQRMIGSNPVWVFVPITWREVGVRM